MKVLFVKDMKKVAKKGDIKEVKDGYAENYLIKNGFAVQVTNQSLNSFTKEKEKEQADLDNKINAAEQVKKELEKIVLKFKVKTGEQDKVFGTVSSKQIKDELHKKGFKIEKRDIELISSLSSLGFHNVKINLFKNVSATIRVELVK